MHELTMILERIVRIKWLVATFVNMNDDFSFSHISLFSLFNLRRITYNNCFATFLRFWGGIIIYLSGIK